MNADVAAVTVRPPMDGGVRFKSMARGFLAVAAGNYGAIVVTFAVSAVLTRHLGAAQFGALALLTMASQVLCRRADGAA